MNMVYEKENLTIIPMWVRFPNVSIHYWGKSYLTTTVGIMGKVIRIDNATLNKYQMSFSRVLVEMDFKNGFHESSVLTNEHNELVLPQFMYDLHPVMCAKYKQMGHSADSCRTGITRRWVAKSTVQAPSVDAEGFQLVHGRHKGRTAPQSDRGE